MSKYRFDNRTEDEFKADIKHCSKVERQLMQRYVDWLNARNDGVYTFEDHGIDNTGEYIKNTKKVSCQADFILYKDGGRPRKIEIKHCNPYRDVFHLKFNHVAHCLVTDTCIVNWMGVATDHPQFCIITPSQLEASIKKKYTVIFWSKECYRFNNEEFEWVTP